MVESILKEISPGISMEGMKLKLKLQYFGHLVRRVDSLERLWCWEGLGAGGEGDDKGWDGWMASPTQWMWVWVNSRSWWWTGRPGMLRFMGSQRVRHDWAAELNWILLLSNLVAFYFFCFLWLEILAQCWTELKLYWIQLKLWFFQWSCMDVRVGLWRKLSTKVLMLLNCGVGEDSWESPGLQGDPTSPF